MLVVEKLIIGKNPDVTQCEDALFSSSDFHAVIDGATSKGCPRDPKGRSGGGYVADLICEALGSLVPDLDAYVMIDEISNHVRSGLPSFMTEFYPASSIAILDVVHSRIIRVGDCHLRIGDLSLPGSKSVDTITSRTRSLMIHLLRLSGEVTSGDPGRDVILPILERQHHLQNNEKSDLGFGCIDGRPVPRRYIEIFDVPRDAEVVLCSDGFDQAYPSLKIAEEKLHELLLQDPDCVGPLMSTKGFDPSTSLSFDDRSYMRLKPSDT